MEYNSENHDQTLLTPPFSRSVLREKVTETLKLPPNLDLTEIRQFLGSAFFNANAILSFQMISTAQSFVFSPAPQTILGRIEQDASEAMCLDLTPYNARELGTSRKHAILYRSDFTLEIQDLDSRNGTYINGYRLQANQIQVLRDRDELVLGGLQFRIAFQYGSTE